MTEYELIEAVASFQSLMHAWVTTYFTALSAYLIAAYFVGPSLTTRQVTTINVCFLVFAVLCAYGTTGTAMRAYEFVQEIKALNPNRGFAINIYVVNVSSAILFFGIIVALKFMWDIRHPKQK